MLVALYLCLIIILSIELFILGTLVGFFQKEFYLKDMLRFLFASSVITLFLGIGYLLGKFATEYLSFYSQWYAATVLFILGFKMFYSAVKLHNQKMVINPLDNKGLIFLSTLSGLNAFFIGIVFKLILLDAGYIFGSFLMFLTALFFGYFIGFKRRKLPSLKYEFISGLLYIIISLIIVSL